MTWLSRTVPLFLCLSSLLVNTVICSLENGKQFAKQQLPAQPTGVTTITSSNGYNIRYSEPGKSGVCETTPDVNSYSGYVDLDNETHVFFWFFEARNDPDESPITLWLEGGPGGDSLFGLYDRWPSNIVQSPRRLY